MKFQAIALIVLLATMASPAHSHLFLKSLIQKKLETLPAVLSTIAGLKSSLTAVKQIQTSPAISETSIHITGHLDTVVTAPATAVHVNTVVAPAPVVHVNTIVAPAPAVHVDTVVAPAPAVHVDTVVAPAPAVHVETVVAPAPVVHVKTVHAPAPVVHVNTVHAPAPVVHVNTVHAPAPVVHVNTVHAPAPVVHVNTVHAPAPVVHVHTVPKLVYAYAPYYSQYETPIHYKEVHPVKKTVYIGGELHKTTISNTHTSSVNAVGNVGLDIRVADEDEVASSGSATADAEFNYASGY